ncbi:MAG TPA: MBL fold metallo-hydrolase [Xanthobacteraceae bacterium]|nr:MBL fold metallo-hydrolase [Xanthobacteraceae bacterium]
MPASLQGELQPTIYRFKLGEFEVANIMDSKVLREGLHPSFGGEHPVAEMEALAAQNRIDAKRYEHPFIPTVVNTGKQLILFDTGNGALRREHEQLRNRSVDGHLVERLRQAGYKPEDVDVVVITHGHPDHIGGLTEGGKPVFANARYVFGATEFDFWKRGENVREARKFNRELFMQIAVPLADRATFVKPGDEIAPGIRAVDAFGHSPGMMAYHVESQGKQLLVWADTAGHYIVSFQRPDWQLDVDDIKDKAIATRKRMFDMAASDKLFVAGYHMPFPALGWVDKTASGYRWVPVGYQLNL